MAVNLCNFCSTFKELRNDRICKDCFDEYLIVKLYIETHPEAPIMVISSDLNISVKKIMIFVEQGRFILVENEPQQQQISSNNDNNKKKTFNK